MHFKKVILLGCFFSSIIGISQPCSTLVFQEIGSEPAFCRVYFYQSGNGVVYASAAGGTPDYTYQWTNMQTGTILSSTTGLNPGEYEVTVIDDAGCVIKDTVRVDSLNPVAEFDVISTQLDANLESNTQAAVIFTNQSQYFANPNDPNADTTFYWNLNAPFSSWQVSHDLNETKDTIYGTNGSYDVCLIALNKNGCDDTLCKTITIHGYASLTENESDSADVFKISCSNKILDYDFPQSNRDYYLLLYDLNGRVVLRNILSASSGAIHVYELEGIFLYVILDSRGTFFWSGKIAVN